MAGYTFSLPKINLWTDWLVTFSVFNESIVIFNFNMILVNGITMFISPKDVRFN